MPSTPVAPSDESDADDANDDDDDACLLHLPLHVLFPFYFYTHVSYSCLQSIISVSHKNALISFV